MLTHSLIGGNNGYLKLWPDILMYYLTIYVVAFTSFLCKFYKPLKDFLHSRYKWIPFSLCVGELLLGLTLLGLLFGECCYFYYDHGWQDTKKTYYTTEERAARTMGQVAAVCMVSQSLFLFISLKNLIAIDLVYRDYWSSQ